MLRVSNLFITKAEASFLRVLLQTDIERQYILLAQVSLQQLLYVYPGQQAWKNKVRAKSIDFLLCDKQTLSPVLAIELDDRSHQQAERQVRDAEVDQLFAAAGLPLLHLPARNSYDTRQLLQDIQGKLNVR